MREEALALVGAGVIALEELPWLLPPDRLRAEKHFELRLPPTH